MLEGPTEKIEIEGETKAYLTLNFDADGNPFEVFMRTDIPELYEWVTALMLVITDALRRGVPLEDITKPLKHIHSSGRTSHKARSGGPAISMVSRIASELERMAAKEILETTT